jgi:hypothetical protein
MVIGGITREANRQGVACEAVIGTTLAAPGLRIGVKSGQTVRITQLVTSTIVIHLAKGA